MSVHYTATKSSLQFIYIKIQKLCSFILFLELVLNKNLLTPKTTKNSFILLMFLHIFSSSFTKNIAQTTQFEFILFSPIFNRYRILNMVRNVFRVILNIKQIPINSNIQNAIKQSLLNIHFNKMFLRLLSHLRKSYFGSKGIM